MSYAPLSCTPLVFLAIRLRCSVADGTTCDAVRPSSRVDCGYPGISQSTCRRRGCCWDPGVRGVPWCYHRAPLSTTTTTTPIPLSTTELPEPNCHVGHPQNRVECGFARINQRTCRGIGCCWDASVYGVPSCFHGVEGTPPTARLELECDIGDPWKRVECGYSGISADICRRRGCCWNETIRGVPWCFHGTATHEPDQNCDSVDLSKRIACGYRVFHPDTCRQLNCCWDKSARGVPWCFRGKDMSAEESDLDCETVDPSNRAACGYAGIHPYTCRQLNCCWNKSHRGVPSCFYGHRTTTIVTTVVPPPKTHCNLPAISRKRCGQHGVSREQCVNKGCCWQSSKFYGGFPSCYHAASVGCNSRLTNRQTCGYIGIDETRCLSRACCWDDSVPPGQPKCYLPTAGQSSVIYSGVERNFREEVRN